MSYFSLSELEIVSFLVAGVCILCSFVAYKITFRQPLYHHLFIVETSTFADRRLVQVLYVGPNTRNRVQWSRLVGRLRQRAQNFAGSTPIQNTDTSFIEQAPSTAVEISGDRTLPDPSSYLIWDINLSGNQYEQDAGRDSQYAAAAAIAVLARGFGAETGRQHTVFSDENSISPIQNSMSSITVNVVNEPNSTVPRTSRPAPTQPEESQEHFVRTRSQQEAYEVIEGLRLQEQHDLGRHENQMILLCPDCNPPLPAVSQHAIIPEDEDAINNQPTSSNAVDDRERFSLRLKFLDDSEMIVEGIVGESIGQFKRKHFVDQLKDGKIVRLIYQGQLLREDARSLDSYGIIDGSVVHCHISNTPYSRSSPPIVRTSYPGGQDAAGQPSEVRRRRPTEGAAQEAPGVPEDDQPPPIRQRDRAAGAVSALYLMVAAVFHAMFPAFGRAISLGLRDVMPQPAREVPGRPNVFWRAYRWFHNTILNADYPMPTDGPQNLEESAEAASRPRRTIIRIGDYLVWIFAGQFLAVWSFVCCFPEVCDRTALALLVLLTLYFVFVVCRDYIISFLSHREYRRPTPPLNVL